MAIFRTLSDGDDNFTVSPNFSQLVAPGARFVTATPELYAIELTNGERVEVAGRQFEYVDGRPASGVVSRITGLRTAEAIVELDGLSLSAGNLFAVAATPLTLDDDSLLSAIMSGYDELSGGPGRSILTGHGGKNVIGGGGGDDHIYANGSDVVLGGDGADLIDVQQLGNWIVGGPGRDEAVYLFGSDRYAVERFEDKIGVGDRLKPEHDILSEVETILFQRGTERFDLPTEDFRALDYIASYADLAAEYGATADAYGGFRHYVAHGAFEQRVIAFDPLGYLASHDDVLRALGTDTLAATRHYLLEGRFEGRTITFDGLSYIAANADLIAALGADPDAGVLHYLEHGWRESRTTTFEALAYLASYGDLISTFGLNAAVATQHYVTDGFREGRETTFDGLQYIASHADLIDAFGVNAAIAEQHYITDGFWEGRAADDFDAAQYLANYADLQAAFGDDLDRATQHFITNGFVEGRVDDLLF